LRAVLDLLKTDTEDCGETSAKKESQELAKKGGGLNGDFSRVSNVPQETEGEE
jgi:hypothetical protein